MTKKTREALEQAVRQELRRVWDNDHGSPAWPAHPLSIRALEARGYVERSERRSRHGHRMILWTITEAGRMALKGPERSVEERPVYLARPGKNRGDYTSDPRHRIDHLETVDKSSLRVITAKAQRDRGHQMEREAAERESQDLEDRLARIRAEARERGVDITRQELSIQQRIESLERKVRRKAA